MDWTTLTFDPLLPWWAIATVGGVATAIVLLGLVARAQGALLRLALMAVLVLTLANPALVREERDPLPDVALLVVDETPSQRVGERMARTEQAVQAIEAKLAAQERNLEVRTIRIQHDSIASGEDGTQLIGPTTRALRDVPSGRIAGVLLLTDGQVHDIPQNPEQSALPHPIHTLLTGERDERDRRLTVVTAPQFGIVGREIEMTVRIDQPDAPGQSTTTLRIRRDGGATETRRVPVGVDHSLTFELDHAGPTVWEFDAEPGPEELTLANNRAVVSVNGVRDRLKVLLISGEPHAGQRMWRNLLKSDPSVDLVHFTILRPPDKQDGTPIEELSLISFPTRELFELKLDEFDLVIFDRYRQRGVLPPAYLQNVVDYVSGGGAVLEAAGPTFAGPYSLYQSPLGRLLPGEPTGTVYEQGFLPQVTDLGRRHPVTADLSGGAHDSAYAPRFGSDGQERLPHWGRWFRQIDSEPLRGNTLMDGVEERPLLILDRFGEGRVAQLNSDQIWLWARGFENGGPQAELLRRIAHWLMKEPELEEDDLRAQVREDRLEILRQSLEPHDRPVSVTFPDGRTEQVTLEEGNPGRYAARIPVKEAGLYRVQDRDKIAMAAAGALNPVELTDVRATPERLAPVAEATGGGIHWLSDGLPDIRRISSDRSTSGRGWIGLRANNDYVVTGISRLPLLPVLLVLLLGLGLAAIAWREESR